MPRRHGNSMIESGLGNTVVENGRIINVDIKHWTVDVRTQYSQRQLLDTQVGAPYLHFNSGEGIFAMPEVGAKVMVCTPSDGAPFVMCFCTTFEREGAPADSDNQESSTIPSTENTEDGAGTEVTFRAGRPYLQQGDLMMRCRDGNQIWLHRGGVVEIMSTGLCRRLYIPLNNVIRDVAENWVVDSLAGSMEWRVERTGSSSSTDREDNATFTLAAKNLAQDQLSTVHLRVGRVDDTKRLRLAIAPASLDEDGESEGDLSFLLEIDEEGTVTAAIAKDVNLTVEGEFNAQIDGVAAYQYGSDLGMTIGGGYSVEVTGAHELEASSSKESLSTSKEISASSIKLGGPGATTPVMLVTPAVAAFGYHIHPTPAGPSGIPQTPLTAPQMQATKVFGE